MRPLFFAGVIFAELQQLLYIQEQHAAAARPGDPRPPFFHKDGNPGRILIRKLTHQLLDNAVEEFVAFQAIFERLHTQASWVIANLAVPK